MASSFVVDLKRELRLPTLRQAAFILISIFAIGAALALLQWSARPVIQGRFALDSVSFPWALATLERAGSFWNLVGWGYFLNEFQVDSLPWWLARKLVDFAMVIAFARVLWWGPLVMQAGAVANILEGGITGQVLDWIIFPDGAQGVRALSLGDICIYGGFVPCVIALTLMWIRLIRSWWFAIRDAVRTARAQS